MIYGMPEVSWDLTLMLLLSVPNSLGAAPACLLYRAVQSIAAACCLLCSWHLGLLMCSALGLCPLASCPICSCTWWLIAMTVAWQELADPRWGWWLVVPSEVAVERRDAGSSR